MVKEVGSFDIGRKKAQKRTKKMEHGRIHPHSVESAGY
jgi:hypothetical protein